MQAESLPSEPLGKPQLTLMQFVKTTVALCIQGCECNGVNRTQRDTALVAFRECGTSTILTQFLLRLNFYDLNSNWQRRGLLRWHSGKKNPFANAGGPGLIPELGRSPGVGYGNPLQYFCLTNPMDRGTCQATAHGITRSQTRPSDWMHTPPPNKTEKTTHLLFWLVFIKCRQENRNSRNVRFPWIDDKDPAMLVTYKSKRSR